MQVEEPSEEIMNHTLLRLLLEEVEMFRKDYSSLIEGNSFTTARRTRKHISNIRKLMSEMSKVLISRRSKIVEAKWGGDVPKSAYRKRKSETEPLIL